MNTELKKGADRPISRDRPANARKPEGGSKPASTRVSPSPSTAAVMVMILFRVPPHRPRSTDPARFQLFAVMPFHQSGSGGVPSEILHAH